LSFLLGCGCPVPVGFRRLDEKCRLPSQLQQIVIACDQQIGFATLRHVEKRLILTVASVAAKISTNRS
jgi:hypothetical protein